MKDVHHMLIRMTRSCAMENNKLCYLMACVVVLCSASCYVALTLYLPVVYTQR